MRVSPEEKRFIDAIVVVAEGFRGGNHPPWYLRELSKVLATAAWLPPRVYDDAVARAFFILSAFSAMAGGAMARQRSKPANDVGDDGSSQAQ